MDKFEFTPRDSFVRGFRSNHPSQGFSHPFYRYPARFSPDFAKSAIRAFSVPGDVVLDPFMGSGTTLVEAMVSGRHSIGSDISPLARFLARAKTTLLSNDDAIVIQKWVDNVLPQLNLRRPPIRQQLWMSQGYQRGVPWPIRKTIELVLCETEQLPRKEQRELVRCALMRTAQWALDCRSAFPTASAFRTHFVGSVRLCLDGLTQMREAVENSFGGVRPRAVPLAVAAAELTPELWAHEIHRKPSLVLTSPPYPSVHVLYHRWQVKGRKEIPTPFWIAGELDGQGASYYTMGSRTPTGLQNYFGSIASSFSRIHGLLADDALVVQLISFSNVSEQLPRYLSAMNQAGFREVEVQVGRGDLAGRVWREVPLRRWYASYQGRTPSSRELLLVHRRH